eukprot:6926695-Pyramimonas_sp.AAC.1
MARTCAMRGGHTSSSSRGVDSASTSIATISSSTAAASGPEGPLGGAIAGRRSSRIGRASSEVRMSATAG